MCAYLVYNTRGTVAHPSLIWLKWWDMNPQLSPGQGKCSAFELHFNVVEITGFEPVASSTPRKRATICAISRNKSPETRVTSLTLLLQTHYATSFNIGPGCGTWTHGLLIPNQARYQTAPIPDVWGSVLDQPKLQGPCSDLNRSLFLLVLQTGIEPVTSRLSVVYSNHLSYWSIFKAGNFSDSNVNWTRLFFVEGKCHIQ